MNLSLRYRTISDGKDKVGGIASRAGLFVLKDLRFSELFNC